MLQTIDHSGADTEMKQSTAEASPRRLDDWPLGGPLVGLMIRLATDLHVQVVLSQSLANLARPVGVDPASDAFGARLGTIYATPAFANAGSSSTSRRWTHVDRALIYRSVLDLSSNIEIFLNEVLRAHIAFKPTLLDCDIADKVRISIRTFVLLSEDQRLDLIAEELLHELQRGSGRGIGRLTAVMEFLGYVVPLDPEWTRSMFELQVLRNLIAHKWGNVDRRFASEMPALSSFVGQSVDVSPTALDIYCRALVGYLGAVAKRASLDHFSEDPGLQSFVTFANAWCRLPPFPEPPSDINYFVARSSDAAS